LVWMLLVGCGAVLSLAFALLPPPKEPTAPRSSDKGPRSAAPSSAPFEPVTASSSSVGPRALRSLRLDDFKGLSWRSVGPANMGGRVADIALAPGNAKMFYVGLGTGGLFKSTNNGITLSSIFDKEATASIGSVVVADAPADWAG